MATFQENITQRINEAQMRAQAERLERGIARIRRIEDLLPDSVEDQEAWSRGFDFGPKIRFRLGLGLLRRVVAGEGGAEIVGKTRRLTDLRTGVDLSAGIIASDTGLMGMVREVSASGARGLSNLEVSSPLRTITAARLRSLYVGGELTAFVDFAGLQWGRTEVLVAQINARLGLSFSASDLAIEAIHHLGSGRLVGAGGGIEWSS